MLFRSKKAIARIARAYVKEGDAVILDSGSTTLELALLLKDAKNIKVITNDLQIALELQENPWIELYIVGGKVRNNFRLTQGAIGTDFLKSIAVNKVFLSPNALSVFEGATTSKSFKKSINNSFSTSLPNKNLKPKSVKGLINLPIISCISIIEQR